MEMNLKSKLIAIFILVVFDLISTLPPTLASAKDSPKHSSCAAPEYSQFDFWLGDWDAFEAGSSAPDSRIQVTRVLDGCALRERYTGADGHRGESLSIYDSSRKVWHQSWFTNRGELLVIEGTLEAGTMVLSGADRTADGRERRVRGIWKPEGGRVRETAVRSADGGKTWQPWFDLVFRPHRGGTLLH
jgi:hypothetical protein